MNSILVILVICLAAATAQSCRDVHMNCGFMIRVQRFPCSMSFMRSNCRKSCGLCGGGPQPPTRGPWTPATRGPPPPPGGSCGKSLYQNGRVIAGTTASPGAWPWQVLLKSNGRAGCGGSLISPEWVVTAAHCIRSGTYTVVLGEHDRNRRTGYEQEITSSRAFTHPSWNARQMNNDIALIKLSRPAQLSRYVNPICLPDRDVSPGTSCYITGWGKTSSRSQMSHILQQAPMQVVDTDTCYRKNKQYVPVRLGRAHICGRGAGRISGCQGDSGGPFACNVNGQWELHGAVSHGSRDCDSAKTYTVFARVATFRSWIRQNTGV